MSRAFLLLCFACSWPTVSFAQDDFSVAGLRAKALKALADGDNRAAVENADAILRQKPDSPVVMRQAADIYLRAGKVKYAVRLFDKYLEKEKDQMPFLWQRGIALYFAKDFKAGVTQFEVHRKVNPNDVENAAWHYLCLAKADSIDKAKQNVLPAPNDPRPPMKEVLEMLKSGDTALVVKKMESLDAKSDERKSADFYGHFYLGLYADAHGKADDAKKHMDKAATDAPHNYMGDVARVYAAFLKDEL